MYFFHFPFLLVSLLFLCQYYHSVHSCSLLECVFNIFIYAPISIIKHIQGHSICLVLFCYSIDLVKSIECYNSNSVFLATWEYMCHHFLSIFCICGHALNFHIVALQSVLQCMSWKLPLLFWCNVTRRMREGHQAFFQTSYISSRFYEQLSVDSYL